MDNFFKRSQKDSSEHQNGERAAKSKKNVTKRKYHEEYLEYGFIRAGLTYRQTKHVPWEPSVWGARQVLKKNLYIVHNRHDVSKSQM